MNALSSTAEAQAPGWEAHGRIARLLGLTLGRGVGTLLREPSLQDMGRWSREALRTLGVRVEVDGICPPGARIWVANHLSWLDPLVLLSLQPAQVLAKAEVGDYPLIGSLARRHGLRFVRRESLASRSCALRGLMSAMDVGTPLLLFPEGTTTRGGGLAPLYRGGIGAAFRKGVPLLPLRLSSGDSWYPWVGDDELLPHLWTLARVGATQVRVQPGPLLNPGDFASEGAWIDEIRHFMGVAS